MASKKSKAQKQSKAQERQERLRELQQQQKRADRRRNILIFGTTGIVAAAIIAGTAWGIMQESDGETSANSRLEPADDVGIDGVESAEIEDTTHTSEDVDYPENPPVGGPHNPTWQNCGFYDEPVADENAVHALEHGAVWITYSPDLPESQVSALSDLAPEGGFVLVSPRDDLPSQVVASAWGFQLQLDGADDPRLQQFLQQYVQGPQTLEAGAACSGGTGDPQ